MPLHAKEFFTEHLMLTGGTVIGDTYYTHPQPTTPLRLRIDFAPTIRVDEYDGLRLQVLHAEQGVLDTAVLSFADHHTFHRRDEARGKPPGTDGYARIRDWHDKGPAPWKGADVTRLRQAIADYTTLWFPSPPAQPDPAPAARQARSHSVEVPGPSGFWLTDPAFRDKLHSATLTLLDIVEDVMNDDVPLTEVLHDARSHTADMLGIPAEYRALVEAEAACQIVQVAGLDAGSPFGRAIGQGLAHIDRQPVEQQLQLVRAAARRYAITAPARPRSAPALPPPGRAAGHSR
ncbi:hypothetical protein [Streptomyces sp. NPDC059928]|uniref:hypothetical protein n=1 Tax=unclassified Streptomyces TaxID=2593676 RepID=UPI003658467B